MKKAKYSLSESGMASLVEKLTKIATEVQNQPATGLQDAQFDTKFVKLMTKVKGLDDVIERNDQLSKTYQGLLNMYGFDTMYDMYLYAKSCDSLPEELVKAKDYSKLVPVKRKVMRNGKETEITVYEDPGKSGSESNEGNSEGRSTPNATVSHARELRGKVHADSDTKDTKKVAKLKQAAKGLSQGQQFQDSSDYYLELNGPDGEIAGIVGYSKEGEYLVMDFYKTNGQVPGIAARGFSELIKLAVSENKGVKVEDNPQARPVFAKFGLEQDGNQWSVDAADLQDVFGESGNESD